MVYLWLRLHDEMSGLENYGSTCYVNSIVQILRYTKPVVSGLLDETPNSDTMEKFLDLLYQGSEPKLFIDTLQDIGFERHVQHDAHEFMITVLDKLYESVKVHNPFEGTFETVLTCAEGHTRTATQPFTSLSINGGVKEGIQAMQEPEEVECKCEECDLERMVKEVRVKPGKALCVHIKRFDSTSKLTYKIPIELTWGNYGLVGSCNHIGTMHGGHYTATALTDDGWFFFNDKFVSRVSSIPDKSSRPYIMVYIQK